MRIIGRRNLKRTGEHLPAFVPTNCIGEVCPNYSGEDCNDAEMEWMTAGGPTEKRNTSKPPLRDEATYVIYGQRCLAGVAPELVAQRVVVFKPEEVSIMMLTALTGRYGEMPVQIVSDGSVSSLKTAASSE